MSLGLRQAWMKGTNQQHAASSLCLDPAVTGMFAVTSLGKAGYSANVANPNLNQMSLYKICQLSARSSDDCLAQKEGLLAMVTPCFLKSKILWPHPLIHRRQATFDSSNGYIGSNKAYGWLAECNFQNLGCSLFNDDVFTNIALVTCRSFS